MADRPLWPCPLRVGSKWFFRCRWDWGKENGNHTKTSALPTGTLQTPVVPGLFDPILPRLSLGPKMGIETVWQVWVQTKNPLPKDFDTNHQSFCFCGYNRRPNMCFCGYNRRPNDKTKSIVCPSIGMLYEPTSNTTEMDRGVRLFIMINIHDICILHI